MDKQKLQKDLAKAFAAVNEPEVLRAELATLRAENSDLKEKAEVYAGAKEVIDELRAELKEVEENEKKLCDLIIDVTEKYNAACLRTNTAAKLFTKYLRVSYHLENKISTMQGVVDAALKKHEDNCPWDVSMFPLDSDEEYAKIVQDSHDRSNVSGFLMRKGWELALKYVREDIEDALNGEEE